MLTVSDQRFMERAFELSRKGLGWVNPNPLVGAVLVKNGKIIGEGYHRRFGSAHAEIAAIKHARRRGISVSGATLYVTLEPCCHHGKTPPCTTALLENKIKRVWIAERDPNPLVAGKGMRILRRHKIQVHAGLGRELALQQNETYRHWIQKKRPLVTLKMSVSFDGKISPARKKRGKVFYLIGGEALEHVHRMRQRYDAICVGIETLLQDNPQLTTRLKAVTVRHPMPVILDSRARTPLDARILKPLKNRQPALVVVGKNAPLSRIRKLEKKGAKVLRVKSNRFGLDLHELIRHLAKQEITGLMVEGGARVAKSFMAQHLMDRAEIALAPMLIGREGVSLESFTHLLASIDPLDVDVLGQDLWLSGPLAFRSKGRSLR